MSYIKIFAAAMIAGAVIAGCDNQHPSERLDVADTDSLADCPAIAFVRPTPTSTPEVTVKMNGVPIQMLWDTGATGSTISTLELLNLAKAEKISEEDHLYNSSATVADGSTVIVPVYVIKELVLTTTKGKEFTVHNVTVSVMDNLGASALLGQNVMKELPEYTFDDEENVIRFKQ